MRRGRVNERIEAREERGPAGSGTSWTKRWVAYPKEEKGMEITVANPQKGRLETIEVTITEANTTWFDDCESPRDIYRITDIDGNLLIAENDYTYPMLIYGVSRADINYDPRKAKELLNFHECW
jgi:hypothetical protein